MVVKNINTYTDSTSQFKYYVSLLIDGIIYMMLRHIKFENQTVVLTRFLNYIRKFKRILFVYVKYHDF